MHQIPNNTRGQAMLGDFPKTIYDVILGSSEAHQDPVMWLRASLDKTK
ncbi:hypothetical protein R50076_25520 [Gilvimarinus japonicus]